mmetsp:Transcript_40329/g.96762  ORF Transcript_40329/g.96762 Transcript_40329/m.96762 type:complete len:227 (-) Transcript_40329:2074-2754(-)
MVLVCFLQGLCKTLQDRQRGIASNLGGFLGPLHVHRECPWSPVPRLHSGSGDVTHPTLTAEVVERLLVDHTSHRHPRQHLLSRCRRLEADRGVHSTVLVLWQGVGHAQLRVVLGRAAYELHLLLLRGNRLKLRGIPQRCLHLPGQLHGPPLLHVPHDQHVNPRPRQRGLHDHAHVLLGHLGGVGHGLHHVLSPQAVFADVSIEILLDQLDGHGGRDIFHIQLQSGN